MTARLSPISADWEKGRALPRPCRGASLFSEQLAPSEMYSRLVGIQVEGVCVRAQIGFFFFFGRYFCYCCCCCFFVSKCRLDFCFLRSDAARSERGRERYTNPMPF